MKKKIFGLFLVLLCILFIPNRLLRAIDIFFWGGCFLIIVTWLFYKKQCQLITPNLLENLKRDYDFIHVGSIQDFRIEKGLELANVNRNFYTDVKIVERFYSLIKKNGYIYMRLVNNRKYICPNKISSFDFCLMHPVTVYAESKYVYKYVYTYQEIFTGIYYIYKKLFSGKIEQCSDRDLDEFILKLCELSNFTKKRHIYIKVKLEGFDDNFSKKISEKCTNIIFI